MISTVTVVPTDADIAYAAGFFDGEGSIMIWRRSAEAPDSGGRLHHRLVTRTRQVDQAPLQWLQQRFGGSIIRAILKTQPNARPSSDWCLSSRLAIQFLRLIQPYAIVKRERIDLAIQFHATYGLNVAAGRKGWTTVTPELWQRREAFRNEMMRLNKRGVA